MTYAVYASFCPREKKREKMKLEMYLDRGNGSSKILSVVEGKAGATFKIPSVTRKMEPFQDGITFLKSGQVYLCGEPAIKTFLGTRYTPLDNNDKIRELAVVVAAAVIEIFPNGGPVELSLGISSPIFHQGIEREIIKELSKLEAGFRYEGRNYVVLLERIGAFQEGVIFLDLNPAFNGVIDLGQGTLLAGFRHPEEGVKTLPLSDGNRGGCNLIISALLSDDRFLKAVKSAGFSAAPCPDKLSSLLSNGRWQFKEIDFRTFLKPYMKVPKQRLENAAQAIKTELKNASPYEDIVPRIAFIGGGSSLIRGVGGDAAESWCERHHLELLEDSPDYQTVYQMYAASQLDSARLMRVSATAEAA
jgi:hypothetical protein